MDIAFKQKKKLSILPLATFAVVGLFFIFANSILLPPQQAFAGPNKPVKHIIGFVSAGNDHSLVLDGDSTLWVFGDNTFGQLGLADLPTVISPIALKKNVKAALAGPNHSLIITEDGTLWSFGQNKYGQLGDGSLKNRKTPTPILSRVLNVATSASHTLAVDESGTVWAFGSNDDGQLGTGNKAASLSPVKIMGGASSVIACQDYSLALAREYTLWAWGNNKYGQLGTGSTKNSYTPEPVLGQVLKVASSNRHTLALRTDDSLWGWGDNHSGQVGDKSYELRLAPVKIMDNVADMAVGEDFSLALRNDGTLWSFGNNSKGQLGLGPASSAKFIFQPTLILKDIEQVSCGPSCTLALGTDGRLWFFGTLASAPYIEEQNLSSAHPIILAEGVELAVASAQFILIIKQDGTLWGIGNNFSGQLGVESLGLIQEPVRVKFRQKETK